MGGYVWGWAVREITTYAHKVVKVGQTWHIGGQYVPLGEPGVLYFTQIHQYGAVLRITTQNRQFGLNHAVTCTPSYLDQMTTLAPQYD